MNNMGNKALKAGAWYTGCTFLLKGISFITMPIFTRLMDPSDIGTYANFTSWISILSGIITLDLFTSVNLAHFEYNNRISDYMSTIAIAGSIYTLTIYGVAVWFKNSILDLLGITDYMFHVMFIYYLVNPAISILHAKYRIYLQYKQTIITSLIPTGLSVIASLIMVVIMNNNKLEARVYGYYSIWVVFSIAVYIYLIVCGKHINIKYLKFALPISIPLIVHTLANTVLSMSDRVMINRICGAEDAGFYSVAYSCAMIVSILWTAINQAWAPWCFEMMHQGKEKEIYRVSKPLIILFSIVVIAVILIAPEILYVMGGRRYAEALYVIPPVMLGFILQMLYTLYVNIESYNKKQYQIMIGTLIAAIFNIVLNTIFIPLFGYIAAAYTTLAGYAILLAIHYLFVKKMGKARIYNNKFNTLVLVISILLGLFATLLYKNTYVRWGIIGATTLILFLSFIARRKIILSAVRSKDLVGIFKALHLLQGDE